MNFKNYTLIELIVVIAILAIIGVIILSITGGSIALVHYWPQIKALW
jgi:prepilin-type N-terminal cleavage/methylation domain-containing protein